MPIHAIKPFLKGNIHCSKYQIFGGQTMDKLWTIGKGHRCRSVLFCSGSGDDNT